MFNDHYDEWRAKRIAAIENHYGTEFFKGRTLLEIGCGYGDIGAYFERLGAIVTCSDAREEHLARCSQLHPNVTTLCVDLDKEWPFQKYDIILHMGVLYHLKDYKATIKKAFDSCDHLALETEVLNTTETKAVSTNEDGYDQAFNGVGVRPSPKAVEETLDECGFTYEMITDNRCNSRFHIYDWEVDDSGVWKHGLRRFWFCKK
jgi:cyclopropane fatty-acyl-phospholipid synthase-like methyltransferase